MIYVFRSISVKCIGLTPLYAACICYITRRQCSGFARRAQVLYTSRAAKKTYGYFSTREVNPLGFREATFQSNPATAMCGDLTQHSYRIPSESDLSATRDNPPDRRRAEVSSAKMAEEPGQLCIRLDPNRERSTLYPDRKMTRSVLGSPNRLGRSLATLSCPKRCVPPRTKPCSTLSVRIGLRLSKVLFRPKNIVSPP